MNTYIKTCWVSLLCFSQLHILGQKRCLKKEGTERDQTIAAVNHKSLSPKFSFGEVSQSLFVYFVRSFTNSQWFSQSCQLLQLLTVNTSSCWGRVISCSSKKTIFISSCYCHWYCTNTMIPNTIYPMALANNVRFYHSFKCAKEVFLLSLFSSPIEQV